MDSLLPPWVNAQTMSLFFAGVAQRHANEFVLMVMDQAGWPVAGERLVPFHMRLMFLPLYSPEPNPAEHLWKALHEDCFANHVFKDLHAVERSPRASAPWRSTQIEPDPWLGSSGLHPYL